MKELVLKSELTQEEIENNLKNVDFFDGIMSGLEEVLAYEKGSAKAATFSRKRKLPDLNVADVRHDLKLSQKEMASVLGVSKRTVEAWETGRSNPSPSARNLLYLIYLDNSLIEKLEVN